MNSEGFTNSSTYTTTLSTSGIRTGSQPRLRRSVVSVAKSFIHLKSLRRR